MPTINYETGERRAVSVPTPSAERIARMYRNLRREGWRALDAYTWARDVVDAQTRVVPWSPDDAGWADIPRGWHDAYTVDTIAGDVLVTIAEDECHTCEDWCPDGDHFAYVLAAWSPDDRSSPVDVLGDVVVTWSDDHYLMVTAAQMADAAAEGWAYVQRMRAEDPELWA